MTWAKISEEIYAHPKVTAAGVSAMGLWTLALAWSNHYLTDGFIPYLTVPLLVADCEDLFPKRGFELADRLVEVGLWIKDDAGFVIHDFADYQPSAREVRAQRERARAQRSDAGSWDRKTPRDLPEQRTDQRSDNEPTTDDQRSAQRNVNPVPVPIDDDDDDAGARTHKHTFDAAVAILVARETGRQAERGNSPATALWLDKVTAERRRRHWRAAALIGGERPDISPEELADALEPPPALVAAHPSANGSRPDRAVELERQRLENSLAGLRLAEEPDTDTIAEVEAQIDQLGEE